MNNMLTSVPETTCCVTDPMLFQARTLIFSGPYVPLMNAIVTVKMNGLGLATIRGYKIFQGEVAGQPADFLAVVVDFANPPAWYVKQNGGNVLGCVFGSDLLWEAK